MPFRVAATAIGVLAAMSWAYAVANWVAALRHRRPGLSVGHMLLGGTRSFDARSFTERGQPYRRRFLLGAALFGASLLAGMALVLVAAISAQGA
ncbi:MAG: hypothetical protein HY658_10970 [Actinobacteria bacterium]|nr:hypothetical protein [Actinomycetota bacterium]